MDDFEVNNLQLAEQFVRAHFFGHRLGVVFKLNHSSPAVNWFLGNFFLSAKDPHELMYLVVMNHR